MFEDTADISIALTDDFLIGRASRLEDYFMLDRNMSNSNRHRLFNLG